jgi:hypothetical protein
MNMAVALSFEQDDYYEFDNDNRYEDFLQSKKRNFDLSDFVVLVTH